MWKISLKHVFLPLLRLKLIWLSLGKVNDHNHIFFLQGDLDSVDMYTIRAKHILSSNSYMQKKCAGTSSVLFLSARHRSKRNS